MEVQSAVLLLWTRSHYLQFGRLSRNVTREVCGYLYWTQTIIPVVNQRVLQVHNLKEGSSQRSDLSTDLTDGCKLVVLSQTGVLCLGHNPPEKTTFFLDIIKGTLELKAPLLVERSSPGVILHQRHVYVFGGNWPSIRKCEEYSLTTSRWRPLPDSLHPKFAFTPCSYKDTILLPEIRQEAKHFEVFHLKSQTFTELSVAMPFSDTASTAFLDGEDLVLVTSHGQLGRWRLFSSQGFHAQRFTDRNPSQAYCTSQPVRNGRKVMWGAYLSCGLTYFDLDSWEVTLPS